MWRPNSEKQSNQSNNKAVEVIFTFTCQGSCARFSTSHQPAAARAAKRRFQMPTFKWHKWRDDSDRQQQPWLYNSFTQNVKSRDKMIKLHYKNALGPIPTVPSVGPRIPSSVTWSLLLALFHYNCSTDSPISIKKSIFDNSSMVLLKQCLYVWPAMTF